MGSVGNPNPWGAYGNYKDCSQGICSIYCPQWCYIIFPPPPPSDNSGTDFSPLIIAVIGILASTFLLVCYYTIISKYCRRRSRDQNSTSAELDENRDEMNHETWQVAPAGLDDAVIKSITVSKYKKGDGLVEGTDCSVCLNEFEEDESLRLLPKCNHAFHLPCIDTWLKSHSSCPLCRSNINVNSNAPTNIPLPPPIPEARSNNINISALEYVQHRYDSVLVVHDLENGIDQPEAIVSLNVSEVIIAKTPTHALGDHKEDSDEIRSQGLQQFRRSVSLDSSSRQGCISIADILRIREDDDGFQVDNHQFSSQEYGKSNNTLHLHCNAAAMERSLSMGRFVFSRHGKGRNSIIPN